MLHAAGRSFPWVGGSRFSPSRLYRQRGPGQVKTRPVGTNEAQTGLKDHPLRKTKKAGPGPAATKLPGNVLLSQAVPRLVPSALEGLTTVFGMGTGVSPPPWSPESPSSAPSRDRRISRRDDLPQASPRPISTGKLKASQPLHLRPINLVISEGPYRLPPWEASSWGGLRA